MTSQNLRRPRAAFLNTNIGMHGASAPASLARKLLASASLALCAVMPFASAASAANDDASTTASFTSQNASSQKFFADIGFLTQAASDFTGVGGNIRIGRYLGETNRLTLDIGVCIDVNPEVTGRFSYRQGSGPLQHDGKIQINKTVVPILFSWEHEWKMGSNKNWAFRLGPAIGAAFINVKEEHNPPVSNVPTVLRSDSGTAFIAGLNAGLRWCFIPSNDRWYADFAVSALGGPSLKLDKFSKKINPSGGRLTISAGLRF
jgi:hypothetical protein